MTLEAGGSTQMFSLAFFPTSITHPPSHIHRPLERGGENERRIGRRRKRKEREARKKCCGQAAVLLALWGVGPIR